MTREEAINEINAVFTPAYANYIITALTEGATVSDKDQETAKIQAIYTEGLEECIRCAMCTNSMRSDRGCDGGCIVDTKMYNKVMTEINSRLLRKIPREGHWIKEESLYGWDGHSYQCSECGRSIHLDTEVEDLEDYPYCHCGAEMREVEE